MIDLFNSRPKYGNDPEAKKGRSSFELNIKFNIQFSEKVLTKIVSWLLALLGATGTIAGGVKYFENQKSPYNTEDNNKAEVVNVQKRLNSKLE